MPGPELAAVCGGCHQGWDVVWPGAHPEVSGAQSLRVWAMLAFFRCFKTGKNQCTDRCGGSVSRAAVAQDGGQQEEQGTPACRAW